MMAKSLLSNFLFLSERFKKNLFLLTIVEKGVSVSLNKVCMGLNLLLTHAKGNSLVITRPASCLI